MSFLSCGHIYYEHANFRPSNTAKHAAFQCVYVTWILPKGHSVTLRSSIGQMSKSYVDLQVKGYLIFELWYAVEDKTAWACISFTCIMHMNASEWSTKYDGPLLYF